MECCRHQLMLVGFMVATVMGPGNAAVAVMGELSSEPLSAGQAPANAIAQAADPPICQPLPEGQRKGVVFSNGPEQDGISGYEIRGQNVSIGEITLEDNRTLAQADGEFSQQLNALVAPYLGKTVTRADLRALQDEVTRLYIEAGYITSWANCVKLDAASTLVIEVTEGFIQDVNIGWANQSSTLYVSTDEYLATNPEAEGIYEEDLTDNEEENARSEPAGLPRDWQYAVNFLQPVLRNEDGSPKRPVNIEALEARLQQLASNTRFASLEFFSRLRVPTASYWDTSPEVLETYLENLRERDEGSPQTVNEIQALIRQTEDQRSGIALNLDTLASGASVLEINLKSVVVNAEDVEDNPFAATLSSNAVSLDQRRSEDFRRYFNPDSEKDLVDPAMIRFALHSLEQQRPDIKAAVVYIAAEGNRVIIRAETAAAPPIEIESIARLEERGPEREFAFEGGRFVEEPEDENEGGGIGEFFRNLFRRGDNVDRDTLVTESERFWRLVQQPNSSEYREFADNLYDLLIRPMEAEFEAQDIEINTLLVAMDADLGLLPLASLYDSEDEVYLAEKYQLASILNFQSLDIRPSNLEQTRLLAMGASEFREADRYGPLTAVPLELRLIKHIWGDDQVEVFRNEEFTLEKLRQERRETPYPIVHLASHANFRSGQPGESSIQFSDTTLPLNSLQLSTLNFGTPPLELLVLSACQTALGSEDAVLGFAGSFLNADVKSVLASLWYVNDLASLLYMMEFYRNLSVGATKAEAVQNSQRALLDEQRTIQNLKELELVMRSILSDERSREDLTEAELARLTRLEREIDSEAERASIAAEFKHPFYWSAYTLVGNPW